jgi:hypothetical protein
LCRLAIAEGVSPGLGMRPKGRTRSAGQIPLSNNSPSAGSRVGWPAGSRTSAAVSAPPSSLTSTNVAAPEPAGLIWPPRPATESTTPAPGEVKAIRGRRRSTSSGWPVATRSPTPTRVARSRLPRHSNLAKHPQTSPCP